MFCILSHNRWIGLTSFLLETGKYSSTAFYHNNFSKKQKKLGRMAGNQNQDKGEVLIRRFEKEKRDFENLRNWVPERGSIMANSGTKFTLMNYNILAQDLLEGHASLYRYHDSLALPWAYRYDRLMFEINQLQPEILCLQELQENCLNQLKSGLGNLNYDVVYKKRTGDKTDGCGIFYNNKLFNLIEYHDVEYYQPNVEVLNRENVALICKFSLKSKPKDIFIVATTHLLFNPRRQDIRLAQVQVLLAELDRMAYIERLPNGKNRYYPCIVCGDLNLQPYSAPYELITNGFIRFDNLSFKRLESSQDRSNQEFDLHGQQLLPLTLGITDNCQHAISTHFDIRDKSMLHHSNKKKVFPTPFNLSQMFMQNTFNKGYLQHNFNFESVYKHKLDTSEPEASTYQDAWITVDYIFFTGSQANKSHNSGSDELQLLSKWSLPTLKYLDHVRIPNLYYGSDHFSLGAKFLLKSTEL